MAILKTKQGNTYNTETGEKTLGTTPTPSVNVGAIPVDNLATTPAPINLQPPKTNLAPNITLPEAQSETEKEIAKIKAQKSSEESGISSLIKDLGIEQGKEAQYITAEGGDTAQKEYDKYKSDLEAEQLSLRRTTERLQRENPEGLFGGGLQQEIDRLERQSLSKQADIAILGNAAKGRYDTARDIAQRKVESAVAPLKAELDAKKFIYENNSALFSKAELSKLDSLIKADERKIETKEKELEKANTMILNALQGKAPSDLITKAQTALNAGKNSTEVAKILGNYSLSLSDRLDTQLKQAQLNKLNTELTTNTDAGELVKINGKDYIRYKDGTISDPILPEAGDIETVVSRIDNKLQTLGKLVVPSVGLSTSAGSLRGAPIPFLFKNRINDWRADAINIIQKLTVDELGRVKSDGVTFGQLSNGERQAVGDAATALGAASIRDDEGNPTGRFKMSEAKVIEEFQKIYDGYALDFSRRTGVSYDEYKQNPDILKTKIADDFIDSAGTALEANLYGGYSTN